jgi:hypothetical protein
MQDCGRLWSIGAKLARLVSGLDRGCWSTRFAGVNIGHARVDNARCTWVDNAGAVSRARRVSWTWLGSTTPQKAQLFRMSAATILGRLTVEAEVIRFIVGYIVMPH